MASLRRIEAGGQSRLRLADEPTCDRVVYPSVGMVLLGWTAEQWAAIPPHEQPREAVQLGTMVVMLVTPSGDSVQRALN